jgi:ribosome-associated protein
VSGAQGAAAEGGVPSRSGRIVDEDARDLAVLIAQIADDKQGSDIVVLQVGDVLGVTEYFVVMDASNRRLVRTLVDEIETQTRERIGRAALRSEGVREQQWVLIDYGDVVVHVFLAEIREFYEIERLYTDVPRVDWQHDPG